MLEKNKDYIEFLMRTMMVTHKPYQADSEIGITGLIPRDFIAIGNLLDIPCDVVVIPKKDFEALQTENEQLKNKLEEFSPVPEYLVSVNGWEESAKFWKKRYDDIFKLVGFSSKEEVEDYLVNEAEADTLHEAILKLKDQVKYTCDEWYSANSRNNSWKAAAECNSPKKLMEKIEGLEGKIKVLDRELKIHTKALQEWKDGTGCPSPSAAKTLIESGASWRHAYNEIKEANRKLGITIEAWQNVTGYTTPEDYLAAKIRTVYAKLEPSDKVWQEFTGCDSPQKAGCKINSLCDDICKLKGDYDNLLKLTGYKSERDIRVVLTLNEQFVYETMRELINSLKRKAKFTDSNWQNATGCNSPEEAETTMRNLRSRIDEIKEFAAIASNWTDRIVED